MPLKLNLTRVGETHLFQSDSFLVKKDELVYIFANQNVTGGDIQTMIEDHEMIPLETESDRRVKYCFWPVTGTDDTWTVDIVAPQDARIALPDRLIEVLMEKEPMSKRQSSQQTETRSQQPEQIVSKATVWITYAWADNKDQDVDFIAQELRSAGLDVKLDRWNIEAGVRLWEQIERFIQSENESDAWVLYATPNSLGSEPCKEEFAYALDRALNHRGRDYPVIGLFPGPVEKELIPAGIRTRLYVSTSDPDWKERIRAAAEGRTPRIAQFEVRPYQVRHHLVEGGHVLEFRPRAGTWYPFVVGIPANEKEKLGRYPLVLPGAPGNPPLLQGGVITSYNGSGETEGRDGARWWTISPTGEATPAKSYYMFVGSLPSRVIFGAQQGPQYIVTQFD